MKKKYLPVLTMPLLIAGMLSRCSNNPNGNCLPMKKIHTATRIMLCGILIACTLFITGCTSSSKEERKLRDLDFMVIAEEKIPEELKEIIEDKKEAPFHIIYTDNMNLYICIGYGEQKRGGYSIAVNELYLSSDSHIVVSTALLEPNTNEKTNKIPSYPYLVIKTEFLEQTVLFEDTSALDSDVEDTASLYIPGIYTMELVLGYQSINVEVIVDKDNITSIRMVNLSDAITTLYPLLEPAYESICSQVYELQTLEGVTYSSDSKYTSLVLLETIQTCLNKATIK